MTFTTRPTLEGTFGMVSSTHWIASQCAMRMLELGGNAFDAAATAGFVLHVVEPHLNGPGGDLPAIIVTADDPTPRVLCGQGPAPDGATVAHYRGEGLSLVPGSGPLAATIPGAVDAWLLLLRDRGTRSLREVLEPAIGYARHGHPLLERVAATVATVSDLFVEDWTTSADLWLDHGSAPTPGALFRNPVWADTLERLVREGEGAGTDRAAQVEAARRAWSQGFVAQAVDAFSRRPFRDSSGERHGGLVTGADLASWAATWEPATTLEWHGHTVAKTGPWGQGPALLQTLALLDALGDSAELDPLSSNGIHTISEAINLSYADREAWYGSGEEPMTTLLSTGYATERATLVGETADLDIRPGRPDGREPRLPAYVLGTGRTAPVDATTGEPTVSVADTTRGDTCHVDVVDRWGNMISATPSGGWLQSSPTIPELGFCLGSRMQMFWLEEGLASSLAPGKRPRTTLTPTLVLRDGEPWMACGTPGGDQQDQWQLLFLLRTALHGTGLQEAIDAPAWHSSGFTSSFYPRDRVPGGLVVESRIEASVVADLERRGHPVSVVDAWSLGRLCAVTRDAASGILRAGANPRGMQGYAVGR
ncbi:gamma-glutamyltransferase family protein [Lapillicoccus sp.]|uniref:gamma-glutamyltransferase family protein n=1 Tax=Lapillicoccus sp. TaxID=1909287 RepID=UPI0025DEF6B3|nr:gamma-glutamyltransferase family protein [Lapillicoccus sp.]